MSSIRLLCPAWPYLCKRFGYQIGVRDAFSNQLHTRSHSNTKAYIHVAEDTETILRSKSFMSAFNEKDQQDINRGNQMSSIGLLCPFLSASVLTVSTPNSQVCVRDAFSDALEKPFSLQNKLQRVVFMLQKIKTKYLRSKSFTFGELPRSVYIVESRDCSFQTKVNLIQLDKVFPNTL